jgi:hypothetical protein
MVSFAEVEEAEPDLADRDRAEPPDDWDLFTIDIDAVTVVFVDSGQLVVDRWSVADGRHEARRA